MLCRVSEGVRRRSSGVSSRNIWPAQISVWISTKVIHSKKNHRPNYRLCGAFFLDDFQLWKSSTGIDWRCPQSSRFTNLTNQFWITFGLSAHCASALLSQLWKFPDASMCGQQSGCLVFTALCSWWNEWLTWANWTYWSIESSIRKVLRFLADFSPHLLAKWKQLSEDSRL